MPTLPVTQSKGVGANPFALFEARRGPAAKWPCTVSFLSITRRFKCSTSSFWPSGSVSSRCRLHTPTPATGSREAQMIFDYSLAGLVTLGLLIYLTYALLRPERF